MSAHENAVQSLINGGYAERQAREILSFVRGEAQDEGYNRGAAAARAAGLTPPERQFLTFALELAADQMASRSDEFDEDDEAALKSLRTLATPSEVSS